MSEQTVKFISTYLTSPHTGAEKDDPYFVPESALIELLADGVLFCNELPDTVGAPTVALWVNCNDLFVPAADAENLPYDEIEPLYKLWKSEGHHGVYKWCCFKAHLRPQAPIEEDWRNKGLWTPELEALPERMPVK